MKYLIFDSKSVFSCLLSHISLHCLPLFQNLVSQWLLFHFSSYFSEFGKKVCGRPLVQRNLLYGGKTLKKNPNQPTNQQQQQKPPKKFANVKVIFNRSLASQKAINFKDHIGTFYIKSGLITVSIKNKT